VRGWEGIPPWGVRTGTWWGYADQQRTSHVSSGKAEVCPTSPAHAHTRYPYPACTGGTHYPSPVPLPRTPVCAYMHTYAYPPIPTWRMTYTRLPGHTHLLDGQEGCICRGVIMHCNTLGEIQHIGLHYNANSATYARDKEH